MKQFNKYLIYILMISASSLFAQIERGDPNARRIGIHRGNQVRTVFGNWGVIAQPGDKGPRGAWKFDTNGYVGDVSPLVGVRLPIKDYTGDGEPDTLTSTIITPVSRPGGGDYAPGGGSFWGFEPIPGFFNPTLDEEGKGVAMSHQPETWPDRWPDHPDWYDSDGNVEWNGYFGRGQMNADQESYFWMDDDRDHKFFERYGFLPDSTDDSRKGAALQMVVRGLQWSNFLAQDVIFWLYEINNVGTTNYDQAVFGTLVGTYVGAEGDEWNDDVSFFAVRDAITYSWDFDHRIRPSANPRWQPTPDDVGYIAYAFLESPGNKYDGIDNDFDDREFDNTAEYLDAGDFDAHTLQAGDQLILIDENTFERSTFTMPGVPTTVTTQGIEFRLVPDSTELVEGNLVSGMFGLTLNANALDGIDNDFDGLIDENIQVHYRQYKETEGGVVLIDTLNPVQYKNFLSGLGVSDRMIDEGRDDGIDNDRDWSRDVETGELLFDDEGFLIDDVGADGKAGTNDIGERDGIPTLGEPNFDKTDVDESDQIGLTSFDYFVPANEITMSDEIEMWQRLSPGHFDVPTSIVDNVAIRGEDGDFVYGSGYFPLQANRTERFSLALAFGDDLKGTIKTKRIAQLIYNSNYNFPRPPEKPTLTAVPGDGQVTLYWDKAAENTLDPTTKERDFEGYKIYKGTDPDFIDAFTITDGGGVPKAYQPIAQFDLDNDISGYFYSGNALYELTNGVPFFLGDNTGIQNSYVDKDVINGKRYYYGLVAYDRGKSEADIFPSENTKFIAKNIAGQIQLDINTAAVIPNAPVAGYVAPEGGEFLTRLDGYSTTTPVYEVMDEERVIDATYEVILIDSLSSGVPLAYGYNVINSASGDTLFMAEKEMREENGDVFNGVYLSFDLAYQNFDSIKANAQRSFWNSDSGNLRFTTQVFALPGFSPGVKEPADYIFAFYDESNKASTANLLGLPLPSRPTNFEIYNVTDPAQPKRLPYSFLDTGEGNMPDSVLSKGDRIFLGNADTTNLTWTIEFLGDSVKTPRSDDTLYISINKPFSSADRFTFTTQQAGYNQSLAGSEINKVRAVPNPYVVTNVFEEPLPPQVRGRGVRVINFINLPPNSKIHIYTSAGNHVRSLTHDGGLQNGTVSWDLRTKEGLDISFGVYFYVVEADGISEKKFGKLAIIK